MISGICVEILMATICAWIGLWGIVDEIVHLLESHVLRCCVYAALLCGALILASLQPGLNVCALL